MWLQGQQTCGIDLRPHEHPGETHLGAAPALGQTTLGPLQFAYQPQLGIEDVSICLLNRVHAHLDKSASTVSTINY